MGDVLWHQVEQQLGVHGGGDQFIWIEEGVLPGAAALCSVVFSHIWAALEKFQEAGICQKKKEVKKGSKVAS